MFTNVADLILFYTSIPALISSIYGMNIKLPYQNDPNLFKYLCILTILIWIVLTIYFYSKESKILSNSSKDK